MPWIFGVNAKNKDKGQFLKSDHKEEKFSLAT